MKLKKLSVLISCLCLPALLPQISAQEENLEIESAIQIADAKDPTPDSGTIRFNPVTNDFEGWNGLYWASLTGFQYDIGSITDVDGNVYRTVKIYDQEWMVENLRVSRYLNGQDIIHIPDSATWVNANYGAWCIYDTTNSNYSNYSEEKFGKLYNWYAVDDVRGLCPSGWHVPSQNEFETLRDSIGTYQIAGGKLKEAGYIHWIEPNVGASNESGFSALPGGSRHGMYFNIGAFGKWWSSSAALTNQSALGFSMRTYDEDLIYTIQPNHHGLSVRCVKSE